MGQSDSTLGLFFRELKRRKVIKTCFLYMILCWVVLQVGDIVYPALGLDPDKASLFFLYLAVAGFPVTFAIAWFLQITPSGIVRTGSFVEQRVLNNLPPINDRRQSRANYFRKEEARRPFRWTVAAETGPLAGLSFAVDRPLVLGRSLDCDLAIVSPQVSRNHARLSLNGNRLAIEDLGSANGTVINGRKIDGPVELRHEDEIRFHDIVFRVNESLSGPVSEMDLINQTTFIQSVDETPPGDRSSD